MSKRSGGIIGCKYKTSSWHLNGLFPDADNIVPANVIRFLKGKQVLCCNDSRRPWEKLLELFMLL